MRRIRWGRRASIKNVMREQYHWKPALRIVEAEIELVLTVADCELLRGMKVSV